MSTAQNIALKENKENINSQRQRVLEYFKTVESASIYQTYVTTQMSEANAKSRISELYKDGLLYLHHEFNHGRNSAYAYEEDKHRQNLNRKLRKREGFERWKKRGEKDNFFAMYLESINVEFKEIEG